MKKISAIMIFLVMSVNISFAQEKKEVKPVLKKEIKAPEVKTSLPGKMDFKAAEIKVSTFNFTNRTADLKKKLETMRERIKSRTAMSDDGIKKLNVKLQANIEERRQNLDKSTEKLAQAAQDNAIKKDTLKGQKKDGFFAKIGALIKRVILKILRFLKLKK